MMNYSVHKKVAALKDLKDSIFERSKHSHFWKEEDLEKALQYLSTLSFATITTILKCRLRLEQLEHEWFKELET